MPKFQLQMMMKDEPIIDAIERKAFEMETGIPFNQYDAWLEKKRSIGKKKFNRIDKRTRRLAIKKKMKGIN
jgi:hypothetical protein